MTKISKVLVVVTFVACLAWLGFVAAAMVGGPNWREMIDARPELQDYEFSLTEGENPVWTAKKRGTTTTVATDKNLAKVILKVEEAIAAEQQAVLRGNPAANVPSLDQQIEMAKAQLQQFQQAAAVDVQALGVYGKRLEQELDQLNKLIAQTTQQIAQEAEQAKQIQDEAEARRGDIQRLRQLLLELRAERERLESLQPKLRDRIEQGQLDVNALERRQEQQQ